MTSSQTDYDFPDVIQVKLPEALRTDEIRGAVGIGLFYVSRGYQPREIPNGGVKNTKIRLSPRAKECLYYALKKHDNKTAAITIALAWVLEQPIHVRMTRI